MGDLFRRSELAVEMEMKGELEWFLERSVLKVCWAVSFLKSRQCRVDMSFAEGSRDAQAVEGTGSWTGGQRLVELVERERSKTR